MPATENARITSLFDNAVLARLERLRLGVRRRFTAKRRGEHLAGRRGASNEFSDYRDYVPGDDVRFVDWNIFARLHRPYMKLYHQEEEMLVEILVDASASMLFDDKLLRARQLAGAFAVAGLFGSERVGVHAFRGGDAAPAGVGPCRGRAALGGVFRFLEHLEGGGDAPVDRAVEAFLRGRPGRGVAVVISDFLTFGSLRRTFNRLFGSGREIFAIQVLAPAEREPALAGDARLVDAETGDVLEVSANAELLALYHEYREALERELRELCRQRGGRFLAVSAEERLEDILFDRMRRGGWLQQ